MRRIILLSMFVVFGCNNSSDKLKELENENKQLKENIATLIKNIDKYKYMPIVYPKSPKIKLGETYEAAFMIGMYNDEKPPIVTVNENKEPQIIDTLIYRKDQRSSIFSYNPKAKGHFVYNAKMEIYTIKKDTVIFPIRFGFDVE